MPPDYKQRFYGATSWAEHGPPIPIEKIAPTFRRMRQLFDQAGYKEKTCSVEVLWMPGMSGVYNDEYAATVSKEGEKNNFIVPITIFRPESPDPNNPTPSMVAERPGERMEAVKQVGDGLEFAVKATPLKYEGNVSTNGPSALVHGSKRGEKLDEVGIGRLVGCYTHIGRKLEELSVGGVSVYHAIEPLRPDETRMRLDADTTLEILAKVDSPHLGILVDTVHFYELHGNNVESMFRAIKKVCDARKCYSVHLSNAPSRVEWEEQGEIAKHTLRLIQMLQAAGCNVTISYEGFDPSMDEIIGLERRKDPDHPERDQTDQKKVNVRSMQYLAGHLVEAGELPAAA